MDTPPWRRPADGRTFGRQQMPAERPSGTTPASGIPVSPGSEIPPSGSADGWPSERNRLADILGSRRPPGVSPLSSTPSSAPPYPYEGDLDDSYPQRGSVPMPRPDWLPEQPSTEKSSAAPVSPEPIRSRHALVTDTLAQGLPSFDGPAGDASAYDSPSFPRKPAFPSPGVPDAGDVESDADGEPRGVLPQRVPAQPDVPRVA
ncbi:MAG TPA: Daple, partial [Actinoplanes sp.]|nr:Daple [Actinoplanes sp.]